MKESYGVRITAEFLYNAPEKSGTEIIMATQGLIVEAEDAQRAYTQALGIFMKRVPNAHSFHVTAIHVQEPD